MNPGTLLDAAGVQALAFAWLRDAVAPLSEYGEREFARVEPFRPGEETPARQRAARIAAIAAALDDARLDAARETLRALPDAAGAIARASMGDTLGDAQFLELLRFADALQRLDGLLAAVPGIAALASGGVRETARAIELGRAGSFGFYLGDAFDPQLASARRRLADSQAELDAVRGRAAAEVARQLGRDDVSGDEFIVMRADAAAGLPQGVRVLREAPTYWLCALQYDPPSLAALERRDAAADAVALAEESVRARLSGVVRGHAAELDRAAAALGEVDVLLAAARFTRRYGCTVAEIVDDPRCRFEGGRFLPLAAQLELDGRAFTPIDVELTGVAVLTGPNMGGKSVCLRTCGFVALAAAFGLPVPAASARVGLFDEIAWLGIGAGDDELGGLLSSFAKEVVRLREVLERGAGRLFVLVDEFARTTTPHEGKALLVSVIERLRERGACAMVATHLAGVAREAGVRHFAVRGLRGIPRRPATEDLHEALATLAASMDYTIAPIEEDGAVRSDALALAALLGLDEALIARAYAALEAAARPSPPPA